MLRIPAKSRVLDSTRGCSHNHRVLLPAARNVRKQVVVNCWNKEKLLSGFQETLRKAGCFSASLAVAGSLLFAQPSLAEPKVVRLPASADPEIFAAQRTMVEAWTIVGEAFVDPDFNNLDWQEELRQHMMAAYASPQPDEAWEEISNMLSTLGDPYTRRIPPEEYQQFRVSADGELQGIGLLIANQPSTSGHLLVLAPIKGGPADRAGILPGDEVVSINGQDTNGLNGEAAANMLRGRGGTDVRIKLVRRSEQIPGVPGRPDPMPTVQYKEVRMVRETVALSPVYSTLLQDAQQHPVGYVRLTQFSNNAPDEVKKAVQSLETQGAQSYILDLRNNPGGLVKAGVDVAALWLDGEKTVFNVQSREGPAATQTTESRAPALTHAPLAILVNDMSASASEILSGALHDNHRAVIVGDRNTYGKGRIQSVFELEDGSALFVTVAKYRTPDGTEIDMKGIHPDRACHPPMMASNPAAGSQKPVSMSAAAAAVFADMMEADADDNFVPGIPLERDTEQVLLQALARDSCVLAAEKYLGESSGVMTAQVPAGVRPVAY